MSSRPTERMLIQMIRLFVIGVLSLFLSACVSSLGRNDLPVSDLPASELDELATQLSRLAKKRRLSNGKVYCVEDSKSNEDLESCAIDLERTLWYSEMVDKPAIVELVERYVKRAKLARKPCTMVERLLRRDRCRLEEVK